MTINANGQFAVMTLNDGAGGAASGSSVAVLPPVTVSRYARLELIVAIWSPS
jgi:hypothetical protein